MLQNIESYTGWKQRVFFCCCCVFGVWGGGVGGLSQKQKISVVSACKHQLAGFNRLIVEDAESIFQPSGQC